MIVEEVRKLRPDDFRPTEKLIVQLMQSMIARGLKDHPAFEELWCLLGELVPMPDQDLGRFMHHGPGPYVDMAKAEALYRRWCDACPEDGIRELMLVPQDGVVIDVCRG